MPRLKPNVNREVETIKSYIGKAIIFCEGKTEYNYLKYFTDIFKVNERSKYTNIDIEIEIEMVNGDAMTVYKHAEKFLKDEESAKKYKDFDKYLIFDCDAPENIEVVIQKMLDSPQQYKLLLTNWRFEIWLLMHFEAIDKLIPKRRIDEKMADKLGCLEYNSKEKANIGEDIDKVIGKLVDENNALDGVINIASFNDSEKIGKGKEMVDKLTNLISIFQDDKLDFSNNKAEDDDLLGDAYEYLMSNFATESGKSKGQFYTPSEVSRVLSKVIGIGKTEKIKITVYDPTCGSGSLLIKVADEAKDKNVSIYGQEMDNATAGLATMNTIMHSKEIAEIKKGNTLSDPQFTDESDSTKLKRFDFVVATNPPFSSKSWSNGVDAPNDI